MSIAPKLPWPTEEPLLSHYEVKLGDRLGKYQLRQRPSAYGPYWEIEHRVGGWRNSLGTADSLERAKEVAQKHYNEVGWTHIQRRGLRR